jgi:hypothetical protein
VVMTTPSLRPAECRQTRRRGSVSFGSMPVE